MRVLAAAAAFLVVASMVMRASFSLGAGDLDPMVEADGTDGAVSLTTAIDQPLFDDVHLTSGETVEGCIRVDARGDVDPDPVALGLGRFSGAQLAAHLHVVVERGEGAGATSDCSGFVASTVVTTGSLLDLATRAPADLGADWDPPAGSTHASYRIVVTLDPDAPDVLQGTRAATDFTWSTAGTATGGASADEVLVRPGPVLQGTFVPLMSLLVACLVALGILLARGRPRDVHPPAPDSVATAYEQP